MTTIPHVPGSRGGWLDRDYHTLGMVCGACQGTGYIHNHSGWNRNTRTPEVVKEYVGKVSAYLPGTKTARLELEETLHVGDRIKIISLFSEVEFVLERMTVVGMDMSIALSNWEGVAILVPGPVPVSALVYRMR